MKRTITITQVEDGCEGGLSVTIVDSECSDATIEGFRSMIIGALAGLGFHPDTVKGAFGEVT